MPSPVPGSGASTRTGESYVEATGEESTVEGLHLLFFHPDDHGNGAFVASASATLQGAGLKQNTISVTLPSEIQPAHEYSVLVVANLARYITDPVDLPPTRLLSGRKPTARHGRSSGLSSHQHRNLCFSPTDDCP